MTTHSAVLALAAPDPSTAPPPPAGPMEHLPIATSTLPLALQGSTSPTMGSTTAPTPVVSASGTPTSMYVYIVIAVIVVLVIAAIGVFVTRSSHKDAPLS